MKAAINACTWNGYAKFRNKRPDVRTFLHEAAKAGYQGVEIGGGEAVLGTPSACRKMVEGYGLEIAAYQTSVTYNPWPPSTKQVKAAIRYAAELGVDTLMTCGGFMPSPRRNTYGFDYDMFAGNLGPFVDLAARKGVTLAYHPHRGCIVETIKETREMVKRLPQLKLCIDIAHLEASGEDALKFVQTFKKRIVYTHIKDYAWKKDTFIELGKGDGKLDVAKCVRALKKTGYDGWLTVELDKKFEGKKVRTPLQSARMCRRYLKTKCRV